MKHFITSFRPSVILCLLPFCLAVFMSEACAANTHDTPLLSVSIEAGANTYKGDFKWNDEGDNGTPQVGADYNIYDFKAKGSQTRLQVEFYRGWLKHTVWEVSGASADVDSNTGSFGGVEYGGEKRTLPQNSTSAAIAGDDFSDNRFAVGYAETEDGLRVLAMVGVIDAEHNFTLNGRGGTSGQARYAATWKGLWFAAEASEQLGKHEVSLRAEYQIPDYKADLSWGIRDFTASQSGDGRISIFTLRYDYWMFDFMSLWVSASSHDWEVRNGTETKHYISGGTETVNLNKVHWDALSGAAGIRFRF